MPLDVITALGAAAAAVVVVKLFLDDRVKDRSLWENHLRGTVEALTQLHEEQKRQGEEAREHYRQSK